MVTTRQRAGRFAVVVMLSLAGAAGTPAAVGASPPSVVPPKARPHGATYAEWSARWWQWAFSTEATAGGPFDDGTIDCGTHQPYRRVWFLAGPFNESGTVDRSCTVPVGTRLLIPVINVECSNLEGDPFYGATPAARAECVSADLFAFDKLGLSIDGRPIENLARFVVISPDFAFTGVAGNPVGVVGTGSSTSRGVFVMLGPLPPGSYIVTFTGTFPMFPFTANATYTVVVTRR